MARATGTRSEILAAQKNECGRTFGFTAIAKPGVDITKFEGYQSMDIAYARKLVGYWATDTSRVLKEASANALTTSIGAQYLRNAGKLGVLARDLDSVVQRGTRLDDALCARIWQTVDPVALSSLAIATSPSDWDLIKQAVQESLPDPEKALDWLKYLAFGAISLTVLYLAKD